MVIASPLEALYILPLDWPPGANAWKALAVVVEMIPEGLLKPF